MDQFFRQACLISVFSISLFPLIKAYSNESPPKEKDHSTVYAELDYLLWFANQDGLYYPPVATGETPNLDTPWNSGVRTTIGIHPSSWDTKLYYTYYSTSSDGSARANTEEILSSCPSTSGLFEVDTNWKLHFNRLDLELGREILLGRDFILRPFIGLEGLDVSQKFNLNAQSVFIDLNTGLSSTSGTDSKNKSSFLSIGTQAGFNTQFLLGAGFQLYGDFSGSILWGKFKIKETYTSSGNSDLLIDQTQHLSQSASVFNCNLAVGFNWKHFFQKSKSELLLKFGWEQHYYTDMIRFQKFYLQQESAGTAAYSSNGNLSLSGFIFGVLFGY